MAFTSSMKLPTSKTKSRKQFFTVGQAFALAAGAASLATVATALFASHMFSISFQQDFGDQSLFDGPTSTVYSHTVISSDQLTAHWGRNSRFLRKLRTNCGEEMPAQAPMKMNHDETIQEESVPLPQTTNEDDIGPGPHVVWLMSFPNSGTSFTLHLTREASNSTTATNYALEGEIRDQPSVPAISGPDGSEGPWLELIPDRITTVPKYILTKTHCGGFCSYCPPDKYIETPRSFQYSCQSGTRAFENHDGDIKKVPSTYDGKLVKKAIHLFRHPLDNIVARFHLDYRRQQKSGENGGNMTHWPELFPKNSTGFHQWCNFMDSDGGLLNLHWIDQDLRDALDGVPCKAEFYRYVQWHNNAFIMSKEMSIPVMLLHYRDYSNHFEETLDKILDFLEVHRAGDEVEFISGKEYGDYYNPDQKQKIRAFLQEFSTKDTWAQLSSYSFEEDQTLAQA